VHNIEVYIRHLEAVLAIAREHFDRHCPSHTEFEESCTTCTMVEAIRALP
jgi:hypothetical protein